jgi:hypothetical protein
MYLTQFEFRDKEYFSKWDNLLQFPADYLPSDPPRQRFRLNLMEELQQLIKDAEPDHDLPPVVVPSFKLGWGSSQANDPGGA